MASILCIGSFGMGNENQKEVADLLLYLVNKFNCKFIIGTGNNIMPNGVSSPKDIQFKSKFEEPYKLLLDKVKFYNILGETDYITRKSLNAEIKYTKLNKKWVLPHNFYCFKKFINNIPIEFIAIDSNITKIKNKIEVVRPSKLDLSNTLLI